MWRKMLRILFVLKKDKHYWLLTTLLDWWKKLRSCFEIAFFFTHNHYNEIHNKKMVNCDSYKNHLNFLFN